MHVEGVVERLKQEGIETVRVQFADFYGVSRRKDVPIDFFANAVEDGVQFCVSIFSIDLSSMPAMGTGLGDEVGYSDVMAVPDLSTLKLVPWQAKTAMVWADLHMRGNPLSLAPRTILKKIVQRYRDRGLEPIIGSELEFYLLDTSCGEPKFYFDRMGSCYTSGPIIDKHGILYEIRRAMEGMGKKIPAYNHEFFASQYEINLLHEPALDAADTSFAFKQAVKEIAHKYGVLGTFMAKPRNDGGGSGLHLHVSIKDPQTGANLFYDPTASDGLSQLARWFIGGQLAHARAMTAILDPTINSYKRHVLGSFSPVYLVWGLDNRTSYVRIPTERGKGTRVENRAADAASNPYLVFAAALAAGLDGIERQMNPGEPFVGDAYALCDPREVPSLPQYLHEAIPVLEKDEYLVSAMGEDFVKAFTAVKRLEVQRFNQFVTDWEFNEYAFHL